MIKRLAPSLMKAALQRQVRNAAAKLARGAQAAVKATTQRTTARPTAAPARPAPAPARAVQASVAPAIGAMTRDVFEQHTRRNSIHPMGVSIIRQEDITVNRWKGPEGLAPPQGVEEAGARAAELARERVAAETAKAQLRELRLPVDNRAKDQGRGNDRELGTDIYIQSPGSQGALVGVTAPPNAAAFAVGGPSPADHGREIGARSGYEQTEDVRVQERDPAEIARSAGREFAEALEVSREHGRGTDRVFNDESYVGQNNGSETA